MLHFRRTTLLLSALALFGLTACMGTGKPEDKNLLVIIHHYPTYLPCNAATGLAVDQVTGLDESVAKSKEGNVTCGDYERDENSTGLTNACFIQDLGADTNETCVIGSNIVGGTMTTGLIDTLMAKVKESNITQ